VNHAIATDKLLYLIHASADHELAGFLKHAIEEVCSWRVFLASKPGEIPTGADWLAEIHRNLKKAHSFLLLLTPQSVDRRWVWYEAGAAWKSGKRQYPVVAAGLEKDALDHPLGALQVLALDVPNEAKQLFKELGGQLDAPDSFCERVRELASVASSVLNQHAREEVEEALGQLGDPPKLLLRQMLTEGGLTLNDMARVLAETPPRFVSDPVSIQRMIDALQQRRLVRVDAQGRWRVRPELASMIRHDLQPSPLVSRLRQLAEELRRSVQGQTGWAGVNGIDERFGTRLSVLREQVERDHGVTDARLVKSPTDADAVREIADGLDSIARNIP
jgi:hypothetical protein